MASTEAAIANMTKEGSKRADTGHYAQVDQDPESEYRQMQIDEPHAPGEARYSVGKPLLKARLCLLTRASLLQRLDVAFEDSAQAGRFGRRLCRSRNETHVVFHGETLESSVRGTIRLVDSRPSPRLSHHENAAALLSSAKFCLELLAEAMRFARPAVVRLCPGKTEAPVEHDADTFRVWNRAAPEGLVWTYTQPQ